MPTDDKAVNVPDKPVSPEKPAPDPEVTALKDKLSRLEQKYALLSQRFEDLQRQQPQSGPKFGDKLHNGTVVGGEPGATVVRGGRPDEW